MRNYDFSPLYRATVGFDQIADLMDRLLTSDSASAAYPPYNIEKTTDEAYRISIAIVGFSVDDISVDVKENALIIAAGKNNASKGKTYLHRGIANRAFEKRFQLAEHVIVEGASYVDGMLNVDLIREVPEALKPRRIEIISAETKALGQKAMN